MAKLKFPVVILCFLREVLQKLLLSIKMQYLFIDDQLTFAAESIALPTPEQIKLASSH